MLDTRGAGLHIEDMPNHSPRQDDGRCDCSGCTDDPRPGIEDLTDEEHAERVRRQLDDMELRARLVATSVRRWS